MSLWQNFAVFFGGSLTKFKISPLIWRNLHFFSNQLTKLNFFLRSFEEIRIFSRCFDKIRVFSTYLWQICVQNVSLWQNFCSIGGFLKKFVLNLQTFDRLEFFLLRTIEKVDFIRQSFVKNQIYFYVQIFGLIDLFLKFFNKYLKFLKFSRNRITPTSKVTWFYFNI